MEAAGEESPTVFEAETAIAFLYFKKKKCDLVVLESGLVEACEKPSDFAPIYSDDLTIKEKVDKIAKTIYGASRVNYTKAAEKALKQIQALGGEKLPVCIAKTQYSLSDDPTLLGAPKDFEITVKNLTLSNGAGFVVVYTGDIMTMPAKTRNI